MKDLKKFKKDDFIDMVKNDRDLNLEEFKKLRIKDLRHYFNFTHINIKSGKKLKAIEGVNCLDCFAEMKNDYRSKKDTRYCKDCLH